MTDQPPADEKSTPVTPYPPQPPQVDDEGRLTEDVHAK